MLTKSSACILLLLSLLFISGAQKKSGNSVDGTNYFRHRRQTPSIECTLPPYPDHGSWKLVVGQGKPGDKVAISSVILFECNPGYKLSSNIPSVCLGKWSSPVPECQELCPPLYPSDTYDLTCIDKLGMEISCTEATHETNLEYICKTFYETPFGYKTTLLCENGKWDNQKPVCQPVCGKKIANDKRPLIYGAVANEKIEHPWVAAIYKKKDGLYDNVCGGSILSQTVVITAAHCVANNYGNVLPKEDYMVGVGKLYREYKAAKDIDAQYLELLKIIVPEDYRGDNRKFAADIAILVVKEEIKLNEITQPVCFTNMKNIHLHARNKGEISGWGFAEGGIPSEVLRSLVIPYKHETICADELPEDWADRYNLRDKICAGFVNKNTSVCTGDSGSGLAFKYREDQRYYIHGIVSLGHQVEYMCNIQQNALYTSVASYYDFVDRLLVQYAPKVKDCILPPYPQNGKWTTDEAKWKPGDSVPSSTILKVQCDKEFQLSSNRNVECSAAHILPTCDMLCSGLHFPKGTYTKCLSREGEYIDCSGAIDGSTLWYSCPISYREVNSDNNRTCEKGSWGSPQPKCIRECGKILVDESGIGSNYPWNAGIYKISDDGEDKKYEFICSGSLVSEDVIVTAAQCVTDESGHLLPADDYWTRVGKRYKEYEDPRDTQADFSNITYIIVHPGYESTQTNVFNVAILKAALKFTLNNFVQPVCVTDLNEFWWNYEDIGLMAGWRSGDTKDVGSEEVTSIEIVKMKNDLCESPSKFEGLYYKLDKMCVGFKSESNDCLLPEDLGKGIVAKHPENGEYYLHGVVGYYELPGCQKNFWTTLIATYADTIYCIASRIYL